MHCVEIATSMLRSLSSLFLLLSPTESPDCPTSVPVPIPPFTGDYCFITNDVTFDIGANDGNTITVVIDGLDDRLVEGTESFTASASITDPGTQPNGVVPAFIAGTDTTAVITIADDDGKYVT